MYRTEIIVNQFEFGAKPNGAGNSNYNNNSVSQNTEEKPVAENQIEYPTDDIDPEDIPF